MHLVQENVELKWGRTRKKSRVRERGAGCLVFVLGLQQILKMEKAPVFLRFE